MICVWTVGVSEGEKEYWSSADGRVYLESVREKGGGVWVLLIERIYIYIVLNLSNFHERFTKCMLTINQYDWKLRWRHESGENGGLTSKCYIYLPTHLCTAVTLRIAMSGPLTLTLKPQEYQFLACIIIIQKQRKDKGKNRPPLSFFELSGTIWYASSPLHLPLDDWSFLKERSHYLPGTWHTQNSWFGLEVSGGPDIVRLPYIHPSFLGAISCSKIHNFIVVLYI